MWTITRTHYKLQRAEQASRRGEGDTGPSPVTAPALPCPPLDFLLWEKPLPSAPSPAAEFLMRAVTFNTHRYTRTPEKSIHPKRAGVLNSNGNRSQADQKWVNLIRCIQVRKGELERAGRVEASTLISLGQLLPGGMPAWFQRGAPNLDFHIKFPNLQKITPKFKKCLTLSGSK